MEREPISDVAEQELKKLEYRISELIQTCERLKSENLSLREEHSTLTAERASLLENQQFARARVESIIARLKSLETA
jgi:cell division protein ZapB